jgi:hypothetical protein
MMVLINISIFSMVLWPQFRKLIVTSPKKNQLESIYTLESAHVPGKPTILRSYSLLIFGI